MSNLLTPLGKAVERQLKNRGLYLADIADDEHFTIGYILDRMKGVCKADERFVGQLMQAFKQAGTPLRTRERQRLMSLIKTQTEPTPNLINPAALSEAA